MESKFSNKLGEVMSLVEEDFICFTTTGDAETYIASSRSPCVGEGFVHGIQDVINICPRRKTNESVIHIDKENDSLTSLG